MMNALTHSPATSHHQPSTLLREFLLSPFRPASWRATMAILLGALVGILSYVLLLWSFAMGGSLLIVLVGFAIVGLGVESCRLVARVERWRMTLVDPRPLQAHSYRP